MIAGLGVDELHVDAHAISPALNAALENIADVQLPSEPLGANAFPLEGERGVAGDHERAADPRQIRGQTLGNPIGEIILLGIAAEIRERQHDDGQTARGLW